MTSLFRIIISSVFVATSVQVATADLSVFEARRTALMDKLDGRVAVLYGGQAQVGGVVEELFIQEPSFYYLTGISEPGAALILAPGEKQYQEILYLQSRDPDVETGTVDEHPWGTHLRKQRVSPKSAASAGWEVI